MKTYFGFSILFIITFTGCFDIVHYIEPQKDKTVFIKYRATSVIAKENGNNQKFDKNTIFENLKIETLKVKPVTKDCSNEYEAGYELTMTVPESAMTFPSEDKEIPHIPYRDKAGQYILLFRGDKKEREADKMVQAILLTAKYRIIIGNAKPVKAVIISNIEDIKKITPSIYSLGPQYYIDIPLGFVFGNEAAVIISFNNAISDTEIVTYFNNINKKREAKKEKERLEQERLDKIEQERIEKEDKIRQEKEKAEMNSPEKIPGQDENNENAE